MSNPGGPHLHAAFACEKLLQEQDGVMSAIRMIDRVHFAATPDGTLIQPQLPITLLVGFKSGSARGRFKVHIEIEKPSGERSQLFEGPVFFEGEERGVNLGLNVLFEPEQEGLYWFDVLFEGNRVTRIPLRAIFQPQPIAGPRE